MTRSNRLSLRARRRHSRIGPDQDQHDGYAIGAVKLRPEPVQSPRAYISRKNLVHNAAVIRELCGPKVGLCAVVKANAYGHGAPLVVRSLARDHIDSFAVSNIDEAEQIYPFVWGKPVLVTQPICAGWSRRLVKLAQMRRFHCTVCSLEAIEYLNEVLTDAPQRLSVHVKLDSGMSRCGCAQSDASAIIGEVRQSDVLKLAGVYTHFAAADQEDLSFTLEQLEIFQSFIESNDLAGDNIIKHTCNTNAALRLPEAHFDMVRVGLGLYGYCGVTGGKPNKLRPVMRIEAPIVQIKRISPGDTVGYGRTFTAERPTVIGIVAVGYADGLSRALSNRGGMQVAGVEVPIIGRVSMDLTVVDLSEIATPAEGMMATVIDDVAGSDLNAEGLAKQIDTITYEVLTAVGSRIKRLMVD